MNINHPRTAAERFAAILDLLHRALAAQGVGGGASGRRVGRLVGPLLFALCARLRHSVARIARLAAQVAAGTLPKPRAPRPGRAPREPVPREPAPPDPAKPALPRGFGWVMRLMDGPARHWVAGARSQLCHLLDDPDMVALVAAAPQAGRQLRPLCRMLGIRPPPHLVLPIRPRRPRRRLAPPRRAADGPAPSPARPAPAPRPARPEARRARDGAGTGLRAPASPSAAVPPRPPPRGGPERKRSV